MTTKVDSIIAALVVLEKAVAGVREAYDSTPETLNVFPCFRNMLRTEETGWGSFGRLEVRYNILAVCHVARVYLPSDEVLCRPIVNKFRAAVFADSTLGGLVANVEKMTATYGAAEWADETHLVIRFELECLHWPDTLTEE